MAENREDDSGSEQDPEEYEAQGQWKLVDLPEVAVRTGEEDEIELNKFRTKLYRMRDNEWKERGVGDLKFLKHKETGKIRIVMRQDKTLLIKLNFFVKG
jgi:Ran-binding protein 1